MRRRNKLLPGVLIIPHTVKPKVIKYLIAVSWKRSHFLFSPTIKQDILQVCVCDREQSCYINCCKGNSSKSIYVSANLYCVHDIVLIWKSANGVNAVLIAAELLKKKERSRPESLIMGEVVTGWREQRKQSKDMFHTHVYVKYCSCAKS